MTSKLNKLLGVYTPMNSYLIFSSLKHLKRESLLSQPFNSGLSRNLLTSTNKFYATLGLTTGSYLYFLGQAKKSKSETVRLGAAGSLTFLMSESLFYNIDAISAKSKMLKVNVGFTDMMRNIL